MKQTHESREPFVRISSRGLGALPREETALFVPGHGGAHQPDEGLHLANFKKALLIFGMGILEADRVLP